MTGRRIAFLHGWGGSWDSTFAAHGWPRALAERGRIAVPVNLPGHADPGASHDPAAYSDLAADVHARLGDGPLDLVGYSLGAKIAMAIAVRWPHAVGRVVLIGVGNNALRAEPSAQAVIAALEGGISAETPAFVRQLVTQATASGASAAALAAVLRRPANPVLHTTALAPVAPRTLLVNGTADRVAMPDGMLRAALCGHEALHVPDIDHAAIASDPRVIAAALAFLAPAAP